MINFTIDCPFDVGDTVYIKTKTDKYAEIECPFCHGKSEYNTGIKIRLGYIDFIDWVVKCRTCEGSGKLQKRIGVVECYEKGKITDRVVPHSTLGWQGYEFWIELENGRSKYVDGENILTEEQYAGIAKEMPE